MTHSRETMIAELGRRHPAAADDVDAILAMPANDAVNEGLLAVRSREEMARIWLRGTWFDGDVKAFEHCGDHPEWLAALKGADALLAVLPSPPDRQQDQDESSVLPRGASAEPVAWQSIETAPKDEGHHILMHGCGSNFTDCSFVGYWTKHKDGGPGWQMMSSKIHVEPTHWMPTPSFDKTGGGA